MKTNQSAIPANQKIDAVRGFNRFYTRQIGVLREGLLQSPFSLTEARVLYEIAHRPQPTATELCQELGLDAGYLSRILSKFEKSGLVSRSASRSDGRRILLKLSAKGRRTFATLDIRQRGEVASMLRPISPAGQSELVQAMQRIESLLGGRSESRPYVLRAHQPGDMGWVIHRHGALYAQEWGYNAAFEALVARICADFLDHFDPARERCWIAERNGAIVGSVFVVRKSDRIAKLRMLIVEPEARGLGLGQRLVDECIRFARQAGYRTLTL